jgi:hypothetical protein
MEEGGRQEGRQGGRQGGQQVDPMVKAYSLTNGFRVERGRSACYRWRSMVMIRRGVEASTRQSQ